LTEVWRRSQRKKLVSDTSNSSKKKKKRKKKMTDNLKYKFSGAKNCMSAKALLPQKWYETLRQNDSQVHTMYSCSFVFFMLRL